MSNGKSAHTVMIAAAMLLSSLLVFLSQNARADSVTWTSDLDFSTGNFHKGQAFETELHETGPDAYVQTIKDMTGWLRKYPAVSPEPRSDFGFSNDSLDGRFVLFGGLDDTSSARNDTWEYDIASGEWVQICDDNVCAPYSRSFPSMAYDSDAQVVVMYGGIAANMVTFLSDVWEYNVTTHVWQNWTSAMRPSGLTDHSMVYDAADKRMVLVGRGVTSMEVWTYQQVIHLWTNVTPQGGPSKRSGFALGYSHQPGHQRVVLFGGAEMMTTYNDSWEYDYSANSWAQINTVGSPEDGAGSSMTYSFKQHLTGLVLWGGSSWTGRTWRYFWDSGTPTWMEIQTTTAPDPPRMNHGLAYDPGSDAILLFGGSTSSGSKLNDTWILENGYRLAGRYASSYFNSYNSETDWQYLFWNQTSPLNSTIIFQLDFSDRCNNSDLPMWRGPDGTSDTHYTTPGTPIWPNPSMCIRFLAELITFNPSTAPALLDVTIIYEPGDPNSAPRVISVSPTLTANPLDAPIYVNFSKPMDTGKVFISIIPNTSFDFPWTWYQGDTKLKITHSAQPFMEGHRYDVCVWGIDKLGHSLNHTGGRYCWVFTTGPVPPFIVSTAPTANSVDVSITSPVIITFNTPMNTSTCWPYVTIEPPVTFDGHTWSMGDTILTLTHVPFSQLTTYTVDVPIGNPSKPCKDKFGLLLTIGLVPVPWSFTTLAINPIITLTAPTSMQPEVAIDTPLNATFSRDMDQSALYYRIEQWNVANGSWENATISFSASWSGRTVTLSHTAAFSNCKPYRVTIWALDTSGRSLIQNPNVPNPWKFMTVGPGGVCAPFMIFTSPANGEGNVPIDEVITIAWYFSPPDTGGMDPSSFVFSVRDQWGNELNSHFTLNWIGAGPSAVELLHPAYPLTPCLEYRVKVLMARDTSGRIFIPGPAENPFMFRTFGASCPPVILWTQPADRESIFPDGMDIRVKFSKEMDIGTVSVSVLPTVRLDPPIWTEGNTTVTLTHDPFGELMIYNVSVSGRDLDGNELARGPVPNPWTFVTTCDPCPPYIVSTSPADGQSDVPLDAPIWINFSEPMAPPTLVFSLEPSAGALTQTWSNNDTTVMIGHTELFVECWNYTARVEAVMSKDGDPLDPGSPNTWKFKTRCIKPFIASTIPANNTLDFGLLDDIVITFSEPIKNSSFSFATIPSLAYTVSWTDPQTAVLSHSTPFGKCTDYIAQVHAARDLDGNDLVPGPVPNPWVFATYSCGGIGGLTVERSPSGVALRWKAQPNIYYYHVFHSTDKFAPWPWPVIANVTSNYAVFPDHITDMSNHFYIVRGKYVNVWSGNSTMGALWHMDVTPNPGGSNAFWFSLPYNSVYHRASDIASELTSAKINLVGKWDPRKQNSVLYYYFHGMWRGEDFSISPGEGLWIGVVSGFDWVVNGTDKLLALTFSFRMQMRTNLYWLSLPYTGDVRDASQLVLSIEGCLGPGCDAKIVRIGKWDFSRQTSYVFACGAGGWTGENFVIEPGDGIWVEIVSSFVWEPWLLTPEIP